MCSVNLLIEGLLHLFLCVPMVLFEYFAEIKVERGSFLCNESLTLPPLEVRLQTHHHRTLVHATWTCIWNKTGVHTGKQ